MRAFHHAFSATFARDSAGKIDRGGYRPPGAGGQSSQLQNPAARLSSRLASAACAQMKARSVRHNSQRGPFCRTTTPRTVAGPATGAARKYHKNSIFSTFFFAFDRNNSQTPDHYRKCYSSFTPSISISYKMAVSKVISDSPSAGQGARLEATLGSGPLPDPVWGTWNFPI